MKIGFFIGIVIAAYFAGKYSAPEKIKYQSESKTSEVMVQDEARKLNQVQRIIETISKDGRPIKKTIIKTVDTSERTTSKENHLSIKESKEIENRRGVVVLGMIGLPLTSISSGPVYGASFHKQFMGPFILGAWAFSDLRVGLSFGIEL